MAVLLAIWLTASAGATPAGAPERYESRTCTDDRLCVYAVAGDDGAIAFRARNVSDWPVTVSLRVRPRNLVSETGNSRTLTLAAGEDAVLIPYERKSAGARTDYRYWFDWAIGSTGVTHDDETLYRLPYASGQRHRVLQGYDSRFSHTGNERYTVDFDMPVGTPVYAARAGVVAAVVERFGTGCWEERCADKANFIVVLHGDGSTGEYYHLERDGALVEPGERVARGQRIGLSGNSGHSTMPHLHFGVYEVDQRGRTRSIPVTFDSAAGPVSRPRRGPGYTAR